MEEKWSVYIIQSDDNSLYTGISKDPSRRFEEHKNKNKGAKFFRARVPIKIVYTESGHTRSSALIREAAIKKLSIVEKLNLINV